MKAKKVMALSLAALMATGVVTPFAATEVKAEEEQVLEVAAFEGGFGRAYWDAVAEAFEAENPGVTVNINANPEIGEIIRPNILAGNPPDFIYLPYNHASGVAKALVADHALADITDVMTEIEDKFLPGFLDNDRMQPYGDGKIYMAPLYYSSMGLWYNKAYMEANELEVPETWDDFFALGDKVKEIDGRSLFTYQGIYPTYLESLIIPTIASAVGPEELQNCRTYVDGAWETENMKSVLDQIAKIGLDGYLMEGTVALDHTQAQGQWLLGNALFHPNGSWVEGEMKDAPREEGFEFGFTAPPVLTADAEKYVYSSLEEMYIPANAKNIDLAKEFLKFMYSDTAIELNAKNAMGVPPIKGAAEQLKDVVSPAVYESYMVYEKGYKPLVGGLFGTVANTEINPTDTFFNQIGDVMTGKETVEEWMAKSEEVGDELRDKLVTE